MTMTKKEWLEKWEDTLSEALGDLLTEVDDPAYMAGKVDAHDELGDRVTVGAWVFMFGLTTGDDLSKLMGSKRHQYIDSADDLERFEFEVEGPEEEQ